MQPMVALHDESGVIHITQVDNGTHGEDGSLDVDNGLIIHRIYDLEGMSDIGEYMQRYIWSTEEDWWVQVPEKPNVFSYWDGTLVPPGWNWDRNIFVDEVRTIRDRKLTETDWTMLSDSPFSEEQKQELVIYRQQLRDYTQILTGDESSLDDLVWPVNPII